MTISKLIIALIKIYFAEGDLPVAVSDDGLPREIDGIETSDSWNEGKIVVL